MNYIRVSVEGRRSVRCATNTIVGSLLDRDLDPQGWPYIAALVNNDLVSLSYPLDVNCEVRYLTMSHSLGMRVYRNSLSFLLAASVADLFPDARFSIEHSLGTGFFYTMETGPRNRPVKKQVERLERHMRSLVARDIPILRSKISFEEAFRFFKRARRMDRIDLLSYRNPPKVVTYSCGAFQDLAHGPLAPRTGVLNTFRLIHYPPGFVLQFPHPAKPGMVTPFRNQPHLFQVFSEHKRWGRIIGVNNIGSLNRVIVNGGIDGFVRIEEAFHEQKLAMIAATIHSLRKDIKVVLISGPSAAGKTTFAKRLAVHMQVYGFRPVTISLDNYYVDDADTPVDSAGRPDYEHVDAVDIKLFNKHLLSLIAGREIELPYFNFATKSREYRGTRMSMAADQVVIIEGIHGLNPIFTHMLSNKIKFRIYVNALTQLNVDDCNRISTTDNRLMRRLVRDCAFRGNSPLTTLRMWPSVRHGEKKWIFPFQHHADATFNSALDYELAVIKPLITPLLMEIKPQHHEYAESRRIQEFLSNFLDVSGRCVPQTSILREYIGSSDFKY